MASTVRKTVGSSNGAGENRRDRHACGDGMRERNLQSNKLKCEPLFSHGPRTAVVSLTRIGEPLHFSTPRISSDTNPTYNTKVFTCAHCTSCSVFNTCTCGLSSCGHACGDRFAFTYGSTTDVTVRRTDKPGGWGVNLVVTCSSHPPVSIAPATSSYTETEERNLVQAAWVAGSCVLFVIFLAAFIIAAILVCR